MGESDLKITVKHKRDPIHLQLGVSELWDKGNRVLTGEAGLS